MKYQLQIQGMHCQGCKGLIEISLEEENVKVTSIDVNEGIAVIELPTSEIELVKEVLVKVFKELPGYTFSQVTQIN